MALLPPSKAIDTRPAAIAAGLLCSLPFLLPWHYRPIPSFAQEWLALALGLLLSGVLLATRRTTHLLLPPVLIAPAALAAVVLLQLALGHVGHPVNALVAAGYLLWSVLLAIAGRSVAAAGADALYATLAWATLAGAGVNAVLGLIQYAAPGAELGGLLFPARALELYGVYGNLAQANHFSTHLALGLASLAWLHQAARLPRGASAAVAVILLGAMALSGSRSSLLYLGWIATFWLIAARPSGTGLPWRRLLVGAALLGCLVAALWLAAKAALLGPQLGRLVLFAEGAGPRGYLWRHALDMASAHSLLGVGIDRFAFTLVGQLQPGEKVWDIDQYAHNLGLQVLATTGLAGLAALTVPLILFARRVRQAARMAHSLWWPVAVFGVLFIHSMLEQPMYYAYFLGFAAFVAGAADPAAWRLRLVAPLRIGLAAVGLAALAVLAQGGADFLALSRAFYSEAGADPRSAAQRQLLATLHQRLLFAPLAELIDPALFVPANASVRDKLRMNARVMQFAPIAEVEFRHAALLAEDGQLAAAKVQFTRAARAYPAATEHYARRLVMMSTTHSVVGPLAVFALQLAAAQKPVSS